MDPTLLIRGVLIGLSIAAPIGPIGVLCIRRTLAEGRTSGLVSGLGVACADALYGSVAALGLSVADALLGQLLWIRLAGGLFLCYLGLRTLAARPPAEATAAEVRAGRGLLGAFGSTFLLTLANPMTILSFAAIFAGLGPRTGASGAEALLLVLGVFAGSALWWLILSRLACCAAGSTAARCAGSTWPRAQ
jgi:threonine/homoserine/homoserine lactone efflux protein